MNQNQTTKLIDKYPDKVPVIIHRDMSCKDIIDIGPLKYLIQNYITVAQLHYLVRKRIKLDKNKSFYLYANHSKSSLSILNSNDTMIKIYNNYHNTEDGILYITYTGENVFGNDEGLIVFS